MNTTFFEATPQQKALANIGRDMMDFSEEYGKLYGLRDVTDDGLRVLNELSHVGNMLTQVGGVWGTKMSDFSDADRKLIVDFINKKVDIQRR